VTTISDMPAKGSTISGLERVASLQGTGNVGIPAFAVASAPRGEVLLLGRPFRADTVSTADNDPGVGRVRWNAAQASATVIFLDNADSDNLNVSTTISTLLAGGYLYLQASGKSRASVWAKYRVTSVVPAGGYYRVGVTRVASSGTIAHDEALHLSLQQPEPVPEVPEPPPSRNVVTTVAPAAGKLTIDASLGDYFKATLTDNCTLEIINSPQACTLSLDITNGSPARNLAYPAGFRWQGGVVKNVSAVAGALDKLVMTTTDSGATFLADMGKLYA